MIVTHRKRCNVLVPQEQLIEGDLQFNQPTCDVVVILPAIQLVVVVPEYLVRGQIWGVSVPDGVLEAPRLRLVEYNRKEVLVSIIADGPVQLINGVEALDSYKRDIMREW